MKVSRVGTRRVRRDYRLRINKKSILVDGKIGVNHAYLQVVAQFEPPGFGVSQEGRQTIHE